jgi:hypothetical protein
MNTNRIWWCLLALGMAVSAVMNAIGSLMEIELAIQFFNTI